MDLDLEVADLGEVVAQRARLLVGRHLTQMAERVDVVRAPRSGIAVEEAPDPLLVGRGRCRDHARLRRGRGSGGLRLGGRGGDRSRRCRDRGRQHVDPPLAAGRGAEVARDDGPDDHHPRRLRLHRDRLLLAGHGAVDGPGESEPLVRGGRPGRDAEPDRAADEGVDRRRRRERVGDAWRLGSPHGPITATATRRRPICSGPGVYVQAAPLATGSSSTVQR